MRFLELLTEASKRTDRVHTCNYTIASTYPMNSIQTPCRPPVADYSDVRVKFFRSSNEKLMFGPTVYI